MSDEFPVELPSEKELERLPKRSIATYALRCALRVQPLWTFWDKPSAEHKMTIVTLHRELIYDGVKIARGVNAAKAADNIAGAAGNMATANAINAAARAVYAAGNGDTLHYAKTTTMATTLASLEACYIVGHDTDVTESDAKSVAALNTAKAVARLDYERLKEFEIEVTNVSETGPLGDLWHGSPPEWYIEAKGLYDKTIVEWEREIAEDETHE